MELNTERLMLRRVRKSDAEAIYKNSRSPNVGPNAGWKPHESVEETRSIMQNVFMMRSGVFAVIERSSGELIGTAGLSSDPRRNHFLVRMLGYSFGEAHWGKGYATEAGRAVINYGFEVLGLKMISAYCYDYNFRSKNVLMKCGMQYEGTLRMGERRYDGKLLDIECYSIMKKD